MDYIDLLKGAIKDTLNDSYNSLPISKDLKGQLLSGHGGPDSIYSLNLINTFETSIVEKLIENIFYKLDDPNEIIGWESSYPMEKWRKYKLDLALDYIKELDYLFGTAVEVKKWFPAVESVPHNVWSDIFKLVGYRHKNIKVGENKFMLLFLNHTNHSENELATIINKCFLDLSYMFEWLRKNVDNKSSSSRLSVDGVHGN